MDDPFDLQRFVDAQEGDYAQALAELRRGRKESHWMWFVFPQVAGLGSSPMARRFAIHSAEEARAYLAHALLGPRLEECTHALLAHAGDPPEDIMGSVDAMKLRSSITLFGAIAGPDSPYATCLEVFFAGKPDPATLAFLKRGR